MVVIVGVRQNRSIFGTHFRHSRHFLVLGCILTKMMVQAYFNVAVVHYIVLATYFSVAILCHVVSTPIASQTSLNLLKHSFNLARFCVKTITRIVVQSCNTLERITPSSLNPSSVIDSIMYIIVISVSNSIYLSTKQ